MPPDRLGECASLIARPGPPSKRRSGRRLPKEAAISAGCLSQSGMLSSTDLIGSVSDVTPSLRRGAKELVEESQKKISPVPVELAISLMVLLLDHSIL